MAKPGRPQKLSALRKELGLKKQCHYNIKTAQFGKVLNSRQYREFLELRPQRHPVHKMLLVYAENGVERVVDSLTMTELTQFVKRGIKYLPLTDNRNVLCREDYIYIRYEFRELYLHKLVSEAYYGRVKCDTESTHHVDFNRHNNQAKNLVFMKHEDHVRLHKISRK